ncbi:hypothetical protein O0I10_003153 [Lichtheimia ornata]|uniref:Uncharacterized protein n=1 Tax=Lichtheimia ornata TaxID=688661 RepID=A0AAD7V9I6_9FUNG|nr:uncharacterized protein O0I10_003153 [Lichtheimia ornata]KAJ8660931.1 hypothetical protein O0I10_003153 [Lichtheimia ornata]
MVGILFKPPTCGHRSQYQYELFERFLDNDILACATCLGKTWFIRDACFVSDANQQGRLMAATTHMVDVYVLWIERNGALLLLARVSGRMVLARTVGLSLSVPGFP